MSGTEMYESGECERRNDKIAHKIDETKRQREKRMEREEL
jgi:hypothetical protein